MQRCCKDVIELGSGVGITGLLCSRFCSEVVMTDHNEEVLKILKRNIELHKSSLNAPGLKAEKLDWGNSGQLDDILQSHQRGFDLVLGANIYIVLLCRMDDMVISEATRHGLHIREVVGPRATIRNLGVMNERTCS